MCDLVCNKDPCFCWDDEVYAPAEDTWLAWRLVEGLPEVGGLGVDVGTGSCALMNALARKVDFAIGIDINRCAAKACKLCSFEAVLCNSTSCLSRPADAVVANLPYLPCDDDPATCWRWGKEIIENLKVKKGGYLVLVWSSLTPKFDLRGYEALRVEEVSLGLETLKGAIFRRL